MRWLKLGMIAFLALLFLLGSACGGGSGGGDGGGAGGGGGGGSVASVTYSLYTSVDSGGVVSPSGGTFSSGDTVTLTATAHSGWRFDHWSGDASGTSPYTTVVMNSNKNVTAHFAPLNPSIRVTIDRIETEADCEPWYKGYGEFYFVVVVTDGEDYRETRIPTSDYYNLGNGERVNLNTACFYTPEVGDYLQIVVAGFEQDSGICYGEYVLGAVSLLGDELVPGLGTGATILLGLIEAQRQGEGFWCDVDDFAGGVDQTWYESQNWGIGTHVLSAPPYLTVWLTIEE